MSEGCHSPMPNTLRGRLRAVRGRVVVLVAATIAALGAMAPSAGLLAVPARASGFDNTAAETQMVNDINADRAQNGGLPPLTMNPQLMSLARDANATACGNTVHGRAQDMIDRGYFAHNIPPCGVLVFALMQQAGIVFSGAGENIGWNNAWPQASSVDSMNTAFMNSSGHRANILGAYNEIGVGAVAAPGSWGGYNGVIMYAIVFAQGPPPSGGIQGTLVAGAPAGNGQVGGTTGVPAVRPPSSSNQLYLGAPANANRTAAPARLLARVTLARAPSLPARKSRSIIRSSWRPF
jgi:uncharacterized protein YkwD